MRVMREVLLGPSGDFISPGFIVMPSIGAGKAKC